MENIRQAVERARQSHQPGNGVNLPRPQAKGAFGNAPGARIQEIELDQKYLESKRIIAYDKNDKRSRAFDMLRTQVLRTMDIKGWKILAVTSPTPGCGKTFTAVNLAFSIARRSERQVLLADLDL